MPGGGGPGLDLLQVARRRFGPLTGSQWTALTVAVISAAILLWWRFHPLAQGARTDPADGWRDEDDDDEPELEPLT